MPTITQAGIVVSSLTNVPASSYSFVNAWTTHFAASAQHSIVIAPAKVGNLLVSATYLNATGVFTAPSSSGTTGWADSGQGCVATATASGACAEWFGHVTTLGSQTLTVPYTGAAAQSCLNVLEFTCPGVDVGTVWSIDTSNKSLYPAGSTALAYPTLVPSTTPEIYAGIIVNSTNFVNAGATPGAVYLGSSADDCIEVYNINTTAALAPAAVGSSADTVGYAAVAMLLKATIAHAIFDNIRIYLQPVPTGRMWIISQIGFEFLPSNTLQTITANIVLNNRVIKPGINPNAGQFQGPPYVTVRAGDTMWVDLFGVPVGASAIANFLYNEYSAYAVPHDLGGVV